MNLLIILAFYLLEAYFYLILAFILLGWIQEIRQSRFYAVLALFVEPFFRIFRGWFVIGQMDFTPMLGLFLYRTLLTFIIVNL